MATTRSTYDSGLGTVYVVDTCDRHERKAEKELREAGIITKNRYLDPDEANNIRDEIEKRAEVIAKQSQ